MALNAANIHVGPGRIWFGTTVPAGNAAPPTGAAIIGHTNGVPATGTEVGHTTGESIFTWNVLKQEIDSEQSYTAVDVFVTGEDARFEFTMLERIFANFLKLLGGVANTSDASRDIWSAGGGTSELTVPTSSVFMSSPIRNTASPIKFEVLFMYKCYSMEPVPFRYAKGGASTVKVTMKGLADTSRPAGDQIFQHFREK